MIIIEEGPLTEDLELKTLTDKVTGVICVSKVDTITLYKLLEDPINGAIHLFFGDDNPETYAKWIRSLVN